MQSIIESTASYESVLGAQMPLNVADLDFKHSQMSLPNDPFPFFRGTYYRWVQHWQNSAADWNAAPKVLSIGDLHIENFGTWRDAETRLCWGVNDFDEAEELPYAHDLIRLAASVRAAGNPNLAAVKSSVVCDAILAGYTATLSKGGEPFVLEEAHPSLRALAMIDERNPAKFWAKLTKLLADAPAKIPADARDLLVQSMPPTVGTIEFRTRLQVGMGSLGRPRFVALCEYRGGWIAREAKAVATLVNGRPSRSADAVRGAIRSHDPCYQPGPKWIVRRLGPRNSRIELDQLHRADFMGLLAAMGAETANVHLGTPGSAAAILTDLNGRPKDWLHQDSKKMAHALSADWDVWKQHDKLDR